VECEVTRSIDDDRTRRRAKDSAVYETLLRTRKTEHEERTSSAVLASTTFDFASLHKYRYKYMQSQE